jgi:hypothetical protein
VSRLTLNLSWPPLLTFVPDSLCHDGLGLVSRQAGAVETYDVLRGADDAVTALDSTQQRRGCGGGVGHLLVDDIRLGKYKNIYIIFAREVRKECLKVVSSKE